MEHYTKYTRPILWSVIAAVVLYLALAIVVDASAVFDAVAKLDAVLWGVILGLSLTNYALRFVRWHGYFIRLGHRIPASLNVAYYLSGFAFTTTPGKVGEAARSLFLKRHGVGYMDSLSAFFSERFVDVIAMVLLAFTTTLTFDETRWPVLVLCVLTVLCFPLFHSRRLQAFLASKLAGLSAGKRQQLLSHFLQLLQSSSVLLTPVPLVRGLLLGILAWGSEGLAFYLIVDQLDVAISLPLAIGIYAASSLVGAISLLPGGLGGAEAAMTALLILAGADPVNAVAATMISRVATLWFAVTLGLGVFYWVESRSGVLQDKKKITERG